MKPKKSFLLRMDPALYAAVEAWAAQELRSVNGQIEWLLRDALAKRGYSKLTELPEPAADQPPGQQTADDGTTPQA